MTRMLASVTGPEEAEIALTAGADIIDLKDPTRGALGAVATAVIRTTVSAVRKRRPVSAVAGDLPMRPDLVAAAVRDIAATGVDYVKLGIFPDGDAAACIRELPLGEAPGTSALVSCSARERMICAVRIG